MAKCSAMTIPLFSKSVDRIQNLLMSAIIPLLPKDDLSFWVGRAVHTELPEVLRVPSMKAFAAAYNINLDEAEKPVEEYKSIGDLFTRKLKEDARPLGTGLVHPCDSKVAEAGPLGSGGVITQIKGIEYTSEGLLASKDLAELFDGGSFVTYYLCPTDYHRVHVPCDANVEDVVHIPGAFWPVNQWSVSNVDQLYAINERVAMVFRTDQGERLALVMVAATNVGAISVSFDDRINSTVRSKDRKIRHFGYDADTMRSGVESRSSNDPRIETMPDSEPIHLRKGDEVGIFSMGSSVVMLLDKALAARMKIDPLVLKALRGQSVKLGVSV